VDQELKQIQKIVEDRLQDQEPDVELLALDRPAPARLRIVIDKPGGVDIALCERFTGLLLYVF
jgi:ribosome maturation factor RimP